MAGATIDHMISLTILIAALLIAMMSFNQMFSTAVAYETNTQVATKAVDIMNTLCLSPGNPAEWGITNGAVLGFGLQDPNVGGYTLGPHSIMRLNTAQSDSQLVYYDKTDLFYNNVSTNLGHAIHIPIGNCINYTNATELLGIAGTYGFSVDIAPTLNVTIRETNTDPLTLNAKVRGSGPLLSGATLKCYLFTVNEIDEIPTIEKHPLKVSLTDSSGSADIEYLGLSGENLVYSLIAYVRLGGLNGVGYYTSNTIADDEFIIPLVEDYNQGELILAHSGDILFPSQSAETLKYNATFFVLTSDFELQFVDLDCWGHLNPGEDPVETQIPSSEVGLLIISYLKNPNQMGNVVVPWGVGTFGVPVTFGNFGSGGGSSFVATEVRQVTINGISYQVKVSAWKLGN